MVCFICICVLPTSLPLSRFLSKFSWFLWCQMETCHFCKATICSSSSCYSSASLNPFSIYNLRHINKYLFLFICCMVNLFIVYSSWISDLYPRPLYVLFCNLHLLFWACHRYFGNLCREITWWSYGNPVNVITYSTSSSLGNQSICTNRNFNLNRDKDMFNFQVFDFVRETKEGPENKDISGKIPQPMLILEIRSSDAREN